MALKLFNNLKYRLLIFLSRYTYGKGVNGVAYVRFGIIDEQGKTIFLPGIEQQISVSRETHSS